MYSQLDYLVAKARIDELVRAADRARMARRTDSGSTRRAHAGLVGRLRGVIGRCPDLTGPEVRSECP